MTDRTIVFAENGRAVSRGIDQRSPTHFLATQYDEDIEDYVADFSSWLGTDTIASVTRTPSGPSVTSTSNTTTTVTQSLQGFGCVLIGITTAAGRVKNFTIEVGRVGGGAAPNFTYDTSGQVGGNVVAFYDRVSSAQGAHLTSSTLVIETEGYYEAGDGGHARYKRATSAPAYNAYFQSADGAYWELVPEDGSINVKQFGAKGDGTTDDAAAINSAFAYLRSGGAATTSVPAAFVIFPKSSSNYLVKSSINATSIRNLTWGIRGPGVIVGQTSATPILDLSDSRYCQMREISIIGSSTNTPNVGVLCAYAGQVSDEHTFIHVAIDGYFTVSAFYNYGSEDFSGDDLICRNAQNSATAYCAVMTGYNSLGVTSPFKTVATSSATSFNDFYVIHGDFRKTTTGSPIFIERSDGLDLISSYAVSYDSPAIIVRAADSFGNEALTLDVHCETSGLTDCVQFTSYTTTATVNGFKFRDYAPQASTSIFKASSGVTVTVKDIDVTLDRFAVAPSSFIWYANGGTFTLRGGRIQIPDTTYLNNVGRGIRYTFRDGSLATYGVVGINQATPSGSLEVASAAAQLAANNTVSQQLRLTKLTTGTPGAGIGVGIEAACQTAAANYEVGGTVELISTDLTDTSEDFDWSFKLMAAGAAAAEKFRILSTGTIQFGTHSAKGAEAFSGFIIVKDAAGNDRKVMVCS